MKPFFTLLFSLLFAAPTFAQPVNCDLSNIDWNNAIPIQITLTDFDFTPNALLLQTCVPYHAVLINQGKRHHDFASKEFFPTTLVKAEGEAMPTRPIFDEVDMSGGRAEFAFIATDTGEFEFYCTHFGHEALGMKGKIFVTNK